MLKRVSLFLLELVLILAVYFSLSAIALSLLGKNNDFFDHYGLAGIGLFLTCIGYCYIFSTSSIAQFAALSVVSSLFAPVIFLFVENSGFSGVDQLVIQVLFSVSLLFVGAPIFFGKLVASCCRLWLQGDA